MHRMQSVKIKDFSNYLKCPLCKGFLIDSFTINECLHSFCKSCIVKYIKRKECCPVYEMKRRRQFYSAHPKAIKFLKKKKIFDKESIGEVDENVFLFDNHNEISLSIEYSETGIPEICDSYRTKDMNPDNPKCYFLCPASLTIEVFKKLLYVKLGLNSAKYIDIMYDDKPLKNEFTLMDIAYIYAWRRRVPMRLFYRINKSITDDTIPENLDTKQLVPSSVNQQQQPISPIKSVQSDDITNECKKLTSSNNNNENDITQQPALKLNKSQDISVLGNIENKLVILNKDESPVINNNHYTNETTSNNKDNDEINNSSINQTLNNTNATTATTMTTATNNNNNNHNTSNANDTSLTITSMVASINKEKKILSKQPIVISSSSPTSSSSNNNEANSLKPPSKILSSSVSLSSIQIEPVLNNDKENEDASINSSILKHQQQNESKKLLINTSNLLSQNELILAGNAINNNINTINTVQQQSKEELKQNGSNIPITTMPNNNNMIKTEKLILPKLPITNNVSNITKDGVADSLASLKPLKPKKQYNKSKKEILPKPSSNLNENETIMNINNPQIVAGTGPENAPAIEKKVKKPKVPNEMKQPKQPKKPKQEKTTVKKEPTCNNNNENQANNAPKTAAVTSNLQQALLAQLQAQQQNSYFQQQQQHQHQNQQQQQQQLQSNFSLPFGGKLPVSAPAASSTPAPSPLLQNNFQIMPMQSLLNSFNPWKQFEGYSNIAAVNQNQMANALINQKYAASLLDYIQSKAQSLQANQSNFLTNNSNCSSNNNNQHQIFQQYFQNSASSSNSNGNFQNSANTHAQNFSDEFKKPLPNFTSFIHETMHQNYAHKQSVPSNHTYSGGDLSSNSSSCGSENSGMDSLKETQMRISESCNLVNDL